MSISDRKTILVRIEAATPESPIAVFRTKDGKLDAVFADTIVARRRVAQDPGFVGKYHKQDDYIRVRAELRNAELRNAAHG